jgi:outer membrane receptor protein involved in Fe transport
MYTKLLSSVSSAAILIATVGTVKAQETEQPTVLEPIVISGEIVERSWLQTGTSVQVFDQKALETKAAVKTSRDVLEKTTNTMVPTGAAKAATIRGVDGTGPAENANAFFAGSRARLGMRIDGRPASYSEIVFGNSSLWDVEKVELLRGPQSTLMGRNAIAGTLAITTRDPTFDFNGDAQTSIGNHGGRRVSGMVNIPIVDDIIAARFAADWSTYHSSVNYQPYAGVDNPGDIESLVLRGKLLVRPDIGLDSTLRITAAHGSYEGPNGEIIVRPFDDRNSNYSEQPVHRPMTTSIGTQFELDLTENWRLEFDTSFTDFEFTRTTAPGGSAAGIDTREFTVEPRIRYKADNGFEVLGGLHVYAARQDEFIEFIATQNFDDTTNTIAVYGESVIPLNDALSLSFGARYEVEKHSRSGGDATGAIASIDSDRTFGAFLPKIDFNWHPDETQSYGVQVSRGYNAGGGGIAFGFPSPFPIIPYEYDAEYAWTYEIYGRQELMDGRLKLKENIFLSRYSDMQLPFDLTPLDTRDELFVVRNAESVVTYGAELGAEFELTDTLSLFGGIGILKTDVEKYPGSGIEGNQLFGAPNLTGNAGISWENEGWNVSVIARYTDSYFTDINNRPRGKTEPHVVADAQAGYEFGNMRIFGEVQNIFNTDTPIAFYPGATSATDTAVFTQPRTFRVGVGMKF